VIKTFGFICLNLSITPCAPKSGEHEDHIIPFFAHAKKQIIDSILFGTYAATLSPFFKFNDFK
jgi:hypothetical protein